jgi:hypothetical protein
MHADDAIAAEAKNKKTSQPAREEAESWLRKYLATGPVLTKDVIATAAKCGICEHTLRRAYKRIGARPKKVGNDGPWYWHISDSGQLNR